MKERREGMGFDMREGERQIKNGKGRGKSTKERNREGASK